MNKKSTILASISLLVILLPITAFGFLRTFISPENISYPAKDHAHLRLQYIYHGKQEDFAAAKYQTPYAKDQCNGDLTKEPIHLHDGKDQITHLHWARITGAQILKNYGLNLIGGLDNLLGYKLDKLPSAEAVPIHGKVLPLPSKEDVLYIYSGDKKAHQARTLEDLKTKDMESFFGKESQARKDEEQYGNKTSFLESIKILADNGTHSDAVDGTQSKSEEELKELNNLIGNLIIFVQATEPTTDQIKAQFDKLEPLSPSTCGG